ncbi:MAG: Rrf2 family transcriptional regulator [Alphaproteobacteria bacterium]|jgi:Rrf2 family protein|nr:transcriptional regulator [Rhodospirillaceae bacterium]MDP6022383.1 Rrf2 family transcriptional regulator [Alphaproteobacteria bacterium]MDP6254437.1 Rrf2 family transcriptional regulator [Alphaproteobacteria bacterium]MDP7053794.1 Rrf2 family transcriptional regulator [Alphaproteobacteria bacterium]MDP7227680.1 Rrf2 family transcriptional regulator [Alphaproteobacteria bacterium]|tara:strand:+ start:4036 stop:4461 length:426 start_codon:yes stop_codon:yes gene_type:complete
MRLQKSTQFALYAVLELAADPERQMSTADIAARYGISAHHLAKVMRRLVRAGLIQSVRGVGGGYRFSGNVRRVTLWDVMELFEPDFQEAEDNEAAISTPISQALDNVRAEIDDLTRATMQSITLKSLLKFAPKEPLRERSA